MSFDPDLLKRTTYSKYLLRRAKELHRHGHELDSAEAVLAAHDSAEMLMRVTTDFLGAKSEQEFMKFWQAVQDNTGIPPPHKGQMDRFNKVRTEFKHRGILPNVGVVSDLLPIVESFCKEIARLFLKLDYEEISLADLIRSSEAREKLKVAEAAKAGGDLRTALESLGLAFDALIREATAKHTPSLLDYRWSAPRVSDHRVQQIIDSLKLDKMSEGVDKVTDTVNMLLLGVDPLKFQKFSQITPLRQHSGTGSVQILWTRDPGILKTEAYEEAYQFVLDSGLRISV
jgi:hypothetical protein